MNQEKYGIENFSSVKFLLRRSYYYVINTTDVFLKSMFVLSQAWKDQMEKLQNRSKYL